MSEKKWTEMIRFSELATGDPFVSTDKHVCVQALLAEVAKAQEQDRPCNGGEPQMIDRLAHVVRTYHGMDTRNAAIRIGVAPIGQPIVPGVHPSKQIYARDDKRSAATDADELRDVRAILRAAGFETGSQPTPHAVNRLILGFVIAIQANYVYWNSQRGSQSCWWSTRRRQKRPPPSFRPQRM